MDFSVMSGYSEVDKDFIRKSFNLNIMGYLTGFLRDYIHQLEIDELFIAKFEDRFHDNAGEGLKQVVKLVNVKGGKVYLTIDEYDALTNSMAINYIHAKDEENEYLNITRKGGFFRSFFETLKGCIKNGLDRVFITGILPITISDMNSGFNIASWITHDPEFINMLGITEKELDTLLIEIHYNRKNRKSICFPVYMVLLKMLFFKYFITE